MDLSAFILVIVLTALFFGFVVWLNIRFNRNNASEIQPESTEKDKKISNFFFV